MVESLILIQGPEVAASRYRILQYIPYFEAHGMRCRVMKFPDTLREYFCLYRILSRYDCVFIQRKRFHFPFLSILRRKSRRIVYDLDDAVMYNNSLAGSAYSRTRQRRFKKMLQNSDAIVAGNSFLRKKSLEINPDVVVIPTSIPITRYSIKDYTKEKNVVTIGWIGDHGSIHYLERLKGVWEEIGIKYQKKVELKIICDVFFECAHIDIKKSLWSEATEVEELRGMDIGVMPLLDDPWSQGKCGLKILQYMGVGIPVVCTPVGVNKDVVIPGVNGYHAKNDKDWIDALSRLIDDKASRRSMGIAGRDILEKGYTLEANASRLLEIMTGYESQIR